VERALADYDEAIQFDPPEPRPHNAAAWLRATDSEARYRDGKQAFALATRACELSRWKTSDYLDTLAAAHAEAGDFAAAVKWQENALAMYSDEEDRSPCRARLTRYPAKMPYRQPASST
jgi:tetratricopeptide (TPR) repeat protein